MATITSYCKYVTNTWTNPQNVTDTDESTYGSIQPGTKTNCDVIFKGFDFTSIPVGSTINSVTLSTRAGTDSYVGFYLMCTRRYSNGVLAEDKSTYTSRTIQNGGKLETFSTSSESYVGSWTRDELCNGSDNDVDSYGGIGFYTRVYNNSTTSTRKLHIYYCKVTVDYTVPTFTISTGASPQNGGSVSGGGSYSSGSTATLTATPSAGYIFKQWQDGNTSNPRSITVSGDATYTATFEPDTVTVYLDARGGIVSTMSMSVSSGGTYGTLPIPTRDGYTFTGWYAEPPLYNGGYLRDNNYIALSRDYMYTDKIAVHIDAYEKNWSDIVNKQIISCTEGGGWGIGYNANSVGHGTEIYIAGQGYKGIDFGLASLSSGWHSFDMIFDGTNLIGYVDGVLKGTVATGGTSIQYHTANGIFIGAEAGDSATIAAGAYLNSSLGSVFIGHTNSRITAVTSSTTVLSPYVHSLYAGWRINHYTTTAIGANEKGTVNSVASYSSENPYRDSITLTAAPIEGHQFVQWSDGDTSNPKTVVVTGDSSLFAIFAPKTYTIYLKDDEGNSLGSVVAAYGSSPVITTTPTKQPSGGATYTFREWNTQRDGSGTSYPLNGLPAATASTIYFAQFDATYSEPDIASITVAPNPATGGQGIVITVVFET